MAELPLDDQVSESNEIVLQETCPHLQQNNVNSDVAKW